MRHILFAVINKKLKLEIKRLPSTKKDTIYYPPTKLEGYSFSIVRPFILYASVSQYLLVEI